ncbi:hypothetical protein ACSFA0_14650 [Variovorax sp. LT1P1]|uniref:hypothetical protein n=1 Tax=Variovorax sp. LT1P1 TaxID=3443730 RepID=UPI003F462847
MSLKCALGSGELHATDFDADSWNRLRTSNRKDRHLKMICCGTGVALRETKLGTRYFSHTSKGFCESAAERAEVLHARSIIASAVRRAGWQTEIEVPIISNKDAPLLADVVASRLDAQPLAFKVQWTHLDFDEMAKHQAAAEQAGLQLVWLMRQQSIPTEKALPAFRLRVDQAQCTVSLPGPHYHPAFASARNKDDAALWLQHIELGAFVIGVHGRKLHYSAQVGQTLPLDVCAAYTDCWRCGKTTGLIIDLCFAASRVLPGASDIIAKIYDFDDEGRGAALLVSTLPADLLAQHDIGQIKSRYSGTRGERYLSNGCVHCDALQGQFFDHEVAYEAKPVTSVDVRFDDRWLVHLEDREAIEKWWFDDRPR